MNNASVCCLGSLLVSVPTSGRRRFPSTCVEIHVAGAVFAAAVGTVPDAADDVGAPATAFFAVEVVVAAAADCSCGWCLLEEKSEQKYQRRAGSTTEWTKWISSDHRRNIWRLQGNAGYKEEDGAVARCVVHRSSAHSSAPFLCPVSSCVPRNTALACRY